MMKKDAEGNNAEFIVFLQPTPFMKAQWSERERECITQRHSGAQLEMEERAVREFYAAFRATQKDFEYVAVSNLFETAKESLYVDAAHYNDVAAARLAQGVFHAIRPRLEQIAKGQRAYGAGVGRGRGDAGTRG